MDAGTSIYRTLVRLYPGEFRRHFGDDLVQHFIDLVERDGPASAWRCTLIDLAVTLPRYRLEAIMSPRRSTASLIAIVTVLAVGAVATFATGFYPLAFLLLLVAGAVAVAERSHLARSLRPATNDDRHRLWARSSALALVAVATLVIGIVDLGDEEHWPVGRVMAYNVVFFGAGIAAVAYLLVGLRRPHIT
jgi:uncharacterized membrane protein YiaA